VIGTGQAEYLDLMLEGVGRIAGGGRVRRCHADHHRSVPDRGQRGPRDVDLPGRGGRL